MVLFNSAGSLDKTRMKNLMNYMYKYLIYIIIVGGSYVLINNNRGRIIFLNELYSGVLCTLGRLLFLQLEIRLLE